jgi:hypothetical protein
MRQAIWDQAGYGPSQEQLLFHLGASHGHAGEARAKLTFGGEQAGKSLSAAMEGASKTFHGRQFWIVAPQYDQGKPEMKYLINDIFGPMGAIDTASTPEHGPWSMTLKGGINWKVISATDVSRIANEAPDGILMVEAAQQPFEAYLRCLGRTGPRRGWLCINGTLEPGGGWFADLGLKWKSRNDEDGVSYEMPSWSNLTRYPGGWENEEIQRLYKSLPEDFFWERYGGRPQPPKGLVFPEFKNMIHAGRPIRLGVPDSDPTNPTLWIPKDMPLECWIDPGYAGGYAVLFVAVYNETIYILDEIYTQYVQVGDVIQRAITHPLWRNVTNGVMDIAGKQHHNQRSDYEWWTFAPERGGAGLPIESRPVGILDGILRTRSFLKVDEGFTPARPRLYIDPKCEKTIWEFTAGYKYKLDQSNQPTKETPDDKNNHSAKAIAYGLVHHFGLVGKEIYRPRFARHKASWEYLRENRYTRGKKRRP